MVITGGLGVKNAKFDVVFVTVPKFKAFPSKLPILDAEVVVTGLEVETNVNFAIWGVALTRLAVDGLEFNFELSDVVETAPNEKVGKGTDVPDKALSEGVETVLIVLKVVAKVLETFETSVDVLLASPKLNFIMG